jgi:hypothetical protein
MSYVQIRAWAPPACRQLQQEMLTTGADEHVHPWCCWQVRSATPDILRVQKWFLFTKWYNCSLSWKMGSEWWVGHCCERCQFVQIVPLVLQWPSSVQLCKVLCRDEGKCSIRMHKRLACYMVQSFSFSLRSLFKCVLEHLWLQQCWRFNGVCKDIATGTNSATSSHPFSSAANSAGNWTQFLWTQTAARLMDFSLLYLRKNSSWVASEEMSVEGPNKVSSSGHNAMQPRREVKGFFRKS